MTNATRTPDEVKAWLERHGVTIQEWANAHGFKPAVVYTLLEGRTRGTRGEAHRVAIALGMKLAPELSEPSPLSTGGPDEDTVRTKIAQG